jgi:hypothetical protein
MISARGTVTLIGCPSKSTFEKRQSALHKRVELALVEEM